jgi:hypothetical protein
MYLYIHIHTYVHVHQKAFTWIDRASSSVMSVLMYPGSVRDAMTVCIHVCFYVSTHACVFLCMYVCICFFFMFTIAAKHMKLVRLTQGIRR